MKKLLLLLITEECHYAVVETREGGKGVFAPRTLPKFASVLGALAVWLLGAGTPQPPVSTVSTSIPDRNFPHSNGAQSITYPYPNPNLFLGRAKFIASMNALVNKRTPD